MLLAMSENSAAPLPDDGDTRDSRCDQLGLPLGRLL